MLPKLTFIRDLDAESLLEIFLVSAISAILGIRLYLHISGYPQIGSGGLHIAHMLWGGLLMLVSIVIMLSLLNRDKYWLAAFLGGLGFGTFIDELGKFITQDNNYFFEPTVSIIYVIFILIYLSIRAIEHLKVPSQTELLINAVEIEKEALASNLDIDRLNKAQTYLAAVDSSHQLFLPAILNLLNQLKSVAKEKNTVFDQLKQVFNTLYDTLAKRQVLNWVIIGIFLVQAGFFLYHSTMTTDIIAEYLSLGQQDPQNTIRSFDELGDVVFSAISGLLVLVGIFRLFKSRLAGFQMFKLALLVNLFLTEFFDFYTNQFEALFGFFFNVLLLIILNLIINREKSQQTLASS